MILLHINGIFGFFRQVVSRFRFTGRLFPLVMLDSVYVKIL